MQWRWLGIAAHCLVAANCLLPSRIDQNNAKYALHYYAKIPSARLLSPPLLNQLVC